VVFQQVSTLRLFQQLSSSLLFACRMKKLQEQEAATNIKPNDVGAVSLPSMEVARTFSEDAIDYPNPLGIHQVHKWKEDKLPVLEQWCPEFRLCSENSIS
jgi:hypothetical protein